MLTKEGRLPHKVVDSHRAMGRSTVTIECPCCSAWTICFVWSLAGSGKKCACGAKHTRFGTVPPTTPKPAET